MKHLLYLAIIASTVILFFYLSLNNENLIFEIISPDTWTYIDASNMLYDEMKPHPTRPLGYSLISGLPKLFDPELSDENYIRFAVLINLLAWFGSVIFFYKSLNTYFDKKTTFFLVLPFIFTLGSIAHIFIMLSETLILFLLSIISFLIVKHDKTNKIKYLVLAATILNFAILVRPGFIYLGATTSVAMFFFLIKGKQIQIANYIFGLFLASIICVAGQNIAMFKEYGKITPSFIDKTTWYCYLGAETQAELTDTPLLDVKNSRSLFLTNMTFKKIGEISSADFKKQLTNNPEIVIKHWLFNVARNSIAGSSTLRAFSSKETSAFSLPTILYKITRIQNTSFTLLFLISALFIVINPFKTKLIVYLLSIIILYIFSISGISFWQGDRFHFVLYQMILIVSLLLIKDNRFTQKWLKLLPHQPTPPPESVPY